MNQNEKLLFLVKYLLSENSRYQNMRIPVDKTEQFQLFHSLVNIRPPKLVSEEFLQIQDEYLQEETIRKGFTNIADLQPITGNIYIWKGDITTLRCGAIVNAANSQMLGCFQPCHSCIDNLIHTFAGVQLRLKCAEIMQNQECEEPTGQAKITPAYNLPCDYVIHTVEPIVQNKLMENHCELLESCYRSCLEMAVQSKIESIAFCCISTGVFGFPQKEAAEIAVRTVQNFQQFLKYPFWQMTAKNINAMYACVNYGEAFCPEELKEKSICINGDIAQVLRDIMFLSYR